MQGFDCVFSNLLLTGLHLVLLLQVPGISRLALLDEADVQRVVLPGQPRGVPGQHCHLCAQPS
jgi:hypothetical protein